MHSTVLKTGTQALGECPQTLRNQLSRLLLAGVGYQLLGLQRGAALRLHCLLSALSDLTSSHPSFFLCQ